jgi:hypothetical protein
MAKSDIEKGYFVCFFHGYRSTSSMTFERLMIRKYGVYAFRTGSCLGGEPEDCYNSISIPVIKEKFGTGIFNKTMREADSLDKIGLGDRQTYYSGGRNKFRKIIYQEIDSKIVKQYGPKDDFPWPTVTFHVDENGKIYDCGIQFCENQVVIDEINRILPKLPQMEYATQDGIPIKDSIMLRLPLNRRELRRN